MSDTELLDEYQAFVLEICSPRSKANERDLLTTAALGLTGEAGEVADLLKNHLFHGLPLDRPAMIDKLGDVLWHLALGATAAGVTLTDVVEQNKSKLQSRYPNRTQPVMAAD